MRGNPNPHFKLAMTLENNSDMSNACLDKKSEIEKEHGFRFLTKMAETMGLFPTHTQSSVMIIIVNPQILEMTKEIHSLQAIIEALKLNAARKSNITISNQGDH